LDLIFAGMFAIARAAAQDDCVALLFAMGVVREVAYV
jgi:hypothetical protein